MQKTKIQVKLSGLSDILFNRFIDHSKELRPPEQKFYITDGNKLVLPNLNIDAFLFGENPRGCAKAFEGKRGKDYISIGHGHVHISPTLIPFKDGNGKAIKFNGFQDEPRFWILMQGGRTKQGSLSIKQEAQPRPAMRLPWSVEFTIELIKNGLIDGTKLYNWFCLGGLQVALGAYRPKFGRFEVVQWEEEKIDLRE